MSLPIILVIIAGVLLLLHRGGGRNAVWGTAILGLIIGIIVALITGDWNLLAWIFAISTFVGTFIEWVGRLSKRQRR